MEPTSSNLVKQASTWSIVWGVLLILIGMLAVASPLVAAVAVNVVLAWLIIFAGVVHLVLAFHTHSAGSVIWKLLVGLAYIAFGFYVIMHPVLAVASLTLLLGALFLVEGVFDIALFFQMRPTRGSGWILFDSIVSLLLGLLIYLQWPSSSAWAIGTLVGASLIVTGVARVMLSLAVRKVTGTISRPLAA
jgi:uncharacterized membrane protein HdeD (DUF308 family)